MARKSKSKKQEEEVLNEAPLEEETKATEEVAEDSMPEPEAEEKVEEAEEEDTMKSEEKEDVKPVDTKYRVTFLVDQRFKGLFRPKGTSMEVPASIAKAYAKRTTLKFEPLN